MEDSARREALRQFFLERQRPNPLLDQTTKEFLEAVAAGDLLTVTSLLDAKPSLAFATDGRGSSAFLIAVRNRRRKIRKLLLTRGVEPDFMESLADYRFGFIPLDRVKALVEKDPALNSRLRFICSRDGRVLGIQLRRSATAGRVHRADLRLWRQLSITFSHLCSDSLSQLDRVKAQLEKDPALSSRLLFICSPDGRVLRIELRRSFNN